MLWHKAKSKHPLLKALAEHLERVGIDAVDIVKNVFIGIGNLILQIAEMPEAFFALILAVGIILITTAMWMRLGHLLEDTAYISYEVAHLIEEMVNAVISGINRLIGWVGFLIHKHLHIDELHFAEKLAAYKNKNTICHHFHNTMNVALFLPQAMLNKHVCPVVRYTYGTPLWDITTVLLAPGFVDARPLPYGDNCAITEADVFCFVANGWRAWGYLAPILIIGFLVKPFAKTIKSAVKFAIDLADTVLVMVVAFLQHELFPHQVVLPSASTALFTKSIEHTLGHTAV
jgi:hypothetical protein